MNEQDHEKIEETINTNHQKQMQYCEEHFLVKDSAMKAFWSIVVVMLGLIGTGVGWALNENTIVSKNSVSIEQNTKDISDLKGIHMTMDTVVSILRQMKK